VILVPLQNQVRNIFFGGIRLRSLCLLIKTFLHFTGGQCKCIDENQVLVEKDVSSIKLDTKYESCINSILDISLIKFCLIGTVRLVHRVAKLFLVIVSSRGFNITETHINAR
jgi:hypothetical protein